MSTNGETADLMVREGIQITESALKLAGLGAKNLAALLIALANDNQKLAGKTNLKRLIHDGEELTIFSVKQEDLKGFQMEAKRWGKTGRHSVWLPSESQTLWRPVLPHRQQGGKDRHGGDHGEGKGCQADQPHF